MADLTVSQGDYGQSLTFTVQTATGGAYDMTGKVVTFKVWHPSRPSVTIVSASTTVAAPSTGVAVYAVPSTAFAATGKFNFELEMSEAGVIDSTKVYTLEVSESP